MVVPQQRRFRFNADVAAPIALGTFFSSTRLQFVTPPGVALGVTSISASLNGQVGGCCVTA